MVRGIILVFIVLSVMHEFKRCLQQRFLRADNYNAITLVAGDVISNNLGNAGFMQGGLTIYEYSISGSGTDQGMDYVEP